MTDDDSPSETDDRRDAPLTDLADEIGRRREERTGDAVDEAFTEMDVEEDVDAEDVWAQLDRDETTTDVADATDEPAVDADEAAVDTTDEAAVDAGESAETPVGEPVDADGEHDHDVGECEQPDVEVAALPEGGQAEGPVEEGEGERGRLDLVGDHLVGRDSPDAEVEEDRGDGKQGDEPGVLADRSPYPLSEHRWSVISVRRFQRCGPRRSEPDRVGPARRATAPERSTQVTVTRWLSQ